MHKYNGVFLYAKVLNQMYLHITYLITHAYLSRYVTHYACIGRQSCNPNCP